ncbi:MAG: GMC family oxidoreductase [Vicinamibacterales bacterium]
MSTPESTPRPSTFDADYIVVGSGAGGGTVAARLAESGFTVLLLEAGGDPRTSIGDTPQRPQVNTLPDDYDVPAFHALSTENSGLRWDFWVRHYADDAQQFRDTAYRTEHEGKPVNGVLYPRAATLGGCTAHNAMILVYPHNADWNQIADLTGDPSWRAERMREYFERIERCDHRPDERAASRLGLNPSRHGWDGWLQTEVAPAEPVFKDRNMRKALLESAKAALQSPAIAITDADRRTRLESALDPNDWRVVEDDAIGIRYTPLTTRNHQRVGSRERVREVAKAHPARLQVRLNALASRVLFDDTGRAIGVEYLEGESLYGAHPRPSSTPGTTVRAFAAREVILAGGAFNTPQLLMLSGIGPAATLAQHGIPVRVALEGVGRNLQDRYEVAVVNRMNFASWSVLEGATFTREDAQYKEWAKDRKGVYASNGAILSVIARSRPGAPSPDLFLYALLGRFEGYFPGYSSLLRENPNCLTWVVLKAHTNNTAGEVTIRSADPRVPPAINFRYFSEGNDPRGEDLKAVAAGVRLARSLAAPLKASGLIRREEVPGPDVDDEQVEDFVRDRAWGHHASCTCPIGHPDAGGVLTTDFKVHGVSGLRVVDASAFPRIPGFFIVSAVYMIGEKAADVIAAEARATQPLGPVASSQAHGRY